MNDTVSNLIVRLLAAPSAPVLAYRAAILAEQRVLPSVAGLPRVIRAIVNGGK